MYTPSVSTISVTKVLSLSKQANCVGFFGACLNRVQVQSPTDQKEKTATFFSAEVNGCARQRKKHCVESQWLRKRIHSLGHNAFFSFRCKPTSLGFAASNFVASCIKQKRPSYDGRFCLVREAGLEPARPE